VKGGKKEGSERREVKGGKKKEEREVGERNCFEGFFIFNCIPLVGVTIWRYRYRVRG
jgi:hypothetical protein